MSRQEQIAKLIEEALQKPVSLKAPYPDLAGDGRRDRITVQYAAMSIAKQAGFQFDLETSMKNAGQSGRRFITPSIRNKPCREALDSILRPAGLTFRTTEGVVLLERRN